MGLITGMLGVIALLVRPYVEEAIAKAQARELSDMASVPAGRMDFQLVDSTHSIDLAEFSIDRHPVTNEAYGLCVQVNKCTPPVGSADFNDPSKTNDPVVWITIVQAETYCEWVDRRLPTAPEWELAVGAFIKSSLDNDHFSMSANYEWTSSYTTEDWQGAIDVWEGETSNLNIEDWIFLQENASLQTTEDIVIYTNPGGAYAASGGLGFRCAKS
jgi:formylglycine-generating enzyme required for sulfatase activity